MYSTDDQISEELWTEIMIDEADRKSPPDVCRESDKLCRIHGGTSGRVTDISGGTE